MAESRKAKPMKVPSGKVGLPARTCGPLGINDQADPNVSTLLGDTPGPLGVNDHADPSSPPVCSAKLILEKPVCTLDGIPLSWAIKEDKAGVTMNYGKNVAKLPAKAEEILKDICRDADLASVTVTSTTRTASDQARIMYENIVSYGVESQKKLYGTAGDIVIDVYVALKKAGNTPDEIKAGMEKKINEVGSRNVSRHCADPSKICVFDVAPSSIPAAKKKKFESCISKKKSISKFLHPPADPAYHIEMKL